MPLELDEDLSKSNNMYYYKIPVKDATYYVHDSVYGREGDKYNAQVGKDEYFITLAPSDILTEEEYSALKNVKKTDRITFVEVNALPDFLPDHLFRFEPKCDKSYDIMMRTLKVEKKDFFLKVHIIQDVNLTIKRDDMADIASANLIILNSNGENALSFTFKGMNIQPGVDFVVDGSSPGDLTFVYTYKFHTVMEVS